MMDIYTHAYIYYLIIYLHTCTHVCLCVSVCEFISNLNVGFIYDKKKKKISSETLLQENLWLKDIPTLLSHGAFWVKLLKKSRKIYFFFFSHCFWVSKGKKHKPSLIKSSTRTDNLNKVYLWKPDDRMWLTSHVRRRLRSLRKVAPRARQSGNKVVRHSCCDCSAVLPACVGNNRVVCAVLLSWPQGKRSGWCT